ncbi:MAG: hypothetical protein U1G07_12635 [Verrucomicrobiota bacterium]
MEWRRRDFLKSSAWISARCVFGGTLLQGAPASSGLLEGSAPEAVAYPHFPDRLHAFVWRNWPLVPIARMAEVVGAAEAEVLELGRGMGLRPPPAITADQEQRSYITVIRRNWHLLPYDQLLQLLGWTAEHLAYILREDDFLFVKLGSSKPKCSPLRYARPGPAGRERARQIAQLLASQLPADWSQSTDPLFGFIRDLSSSGLEREGTVAQPPSGGPRFCYSYFALYGDPLLATDNDPYPEGYLRRLADLGVNGVWLQAVLTKLAPFPWTEESAEERQTRLRNLRALAARAGKYGIGIYLYLNEPRAMPLRFYERHPELKGVSEGGYAALCTSQAEVRQAIEAAVTSLCKAVPELAGLFTITASENLTNCWSHGAGTNCPRCAKRAAPDVIAEINRVIHQGIAAAGSRTELLVWDWGWQDEWAEAVISQLPAGSSLMSVSEWSIPIRRGGIDAVVGEYSISTVGPGPRARRHWQAARKRGLRTVAKVQAGNTWELSAVPYIPALENVARHVAGLREAGLRDLMLGWTLGGYPSPNLEVACRIATAPDADNLPLEERVARILLAVADQRFGKAAAPAVVEAWRLCSRAFSEFPFDGGVVYNAPMQFGPSNLLWSAPTGYRATMVGFPYDDLDGWRQAYPTEVFIAQFNKVAAGFEQASAGLRVAVAGLPLNTAQERAFRQEIDVITAAAIHFRSTANQARFVQLRDAARAKPTHGLVSELRQVLESETALATALLAIQQRDARIGFEASNQYYYVPQDLAEKVLNCRHLLEAWLPELRPGVEREKEH